MLQIHANTNTNTVLDIQVRMKIEMQMQIQRLQINQTSLIMPLLNAFPPMNAANQQHPQCKQTPLFMSLLNAFPPMNAANQQHPKCIADHQTTAIHHWWCIPAYERNTHWLLVILSRLWVHALQANALIPPTGCSSPAKAKLTGECSQQQAHLPQLPQARIIS